ncbi:uncharacterized protein LOC121747499 [Salvia splendens]|uniref:uncharacterized protein LOC121747499 n=1 Tax=Salvia splendens TaxID=180675 RepID=UPI001C27BDEC|nr:uncharacterized protein LOC121747499 [Salvia splendens]
MQGSQHRSIFLLTRHLHLPLVTRLPHIPLFPGARSTAAGVRQRPSLLREAPDVVAVRARLKARHRHSCYCSSGVASSSSRAASIGVLVEVGIDEDVKEDKG